jgi:hypothetical protein
MHEFGGTGIAEDGVMAIVSLLDQLAALRQQAFAIAEEPAARPLA